MQRVKIKLGKAVGPWSYMPSVDKTVTIIIDDGEDPAEWAKGHADHLGIQFVEVVSVEQNVED